jgi:Protein of unknown function (DUF1488)
MVFFTFPEDARWSEERAAVEFSVLVGEYHGTMRVHRRVFQRLLDQPPTPQRCLEAFHLQRTRFERAVERKLETTTVDRGRQSRDHGARPARTRTTASCWLSTGLRT